MTLALNLIGPGRAGRALASLLSRSDACQLQDVLGRSLPSAQQAIAFLGAGRAAAEMAAMRPAQIWLIATPDTVVAETAAALAVARVLRPGDIVWHCSGALSSAELAPAREAGAQLASVHPLKSFADPAVAMKSFAGTWCTAEGDERALAVLLPLFEALGARIARIDAAGKTLYHSGAVLACNALTALMQAGLRAFAHAGVARETALLMMEPLARETLDNVFRLGPVPALTGPVARGDDAVVARQLDALRQVDAEVAEVYRALSVIALGLAKAQGGAAEAALASLQKTLKNINKNNIL